MTVGDEGRRRWDFSGEYYRVLMIGYAALWKAFKRSGLTQDQLAERLGVDKGLISKRLKGRENLTLKTLSYMATAMDCRLDVNYVPFERIEVNSCPMCSDRSREATTEAAITVYVLAYDVEQPTTPENRNGMIQFRGEMVPEVRVQ